MAQVNPSLWAGQLKLTIQPSRVVDTLTNFPVAIHLSAASGIGSVDVTAVFDELASDANRKKIAVTDSVYNQLYVEIELWDDANENAVLHVKVPSVSPSANTTLYLFYDSTQSENTTYVGDTGDAVSQNVWDANFMAVYHMSQDPNGDAANAIKDSTSNANHGTPEGTMTTADLVAGKMGKCIEFDGTNDAINCGHDSSLNPTVALTMEAVTYCVDPTVTNSGDPRMLSKGASPECYSLYIDASGPLIKADIYGEEDGYSDTWTYWGGYPEDATWYHWAMTIADDVSGSYATYTNGIEEDSSSDDPITIDSNVGDLLLGKTSGGTDHFTGKLDEIRLSNTNRSAAWIKATYHSLWDSLITFGSEEGVRIFYPSVTADDGKWTGFPSFYNTTNLVWGSYNYPDHAFIRFPNVDIPSGATITSAFIRLYTGASNFGNTNVFSKVYFENSADAVAPTDATEAEALSLTSGIDWDDNSNWPNSTTHDSPDISAALQEVIDLVGWASGQAVMVLIKDDGSGYHQTHGCADLTSGVIQELHVEWSIIDPNVSVSATTASLMIAPQAATIIGATTVWAETASIAVTTFRTAQNIEVEAGVVPLTVTPMAAAVFYGQLVSAELVSLTSTANPASVVFNIPVDATTVALTITPNAATISYDIDITATSQPLTITPYNAAVWDGAAWSAWITENKDKISYLYYFTLTGDGETPAVTDVVIPISSFQCRRRSDSPTYLSVVIPGTDYSSQITARPNGDMKLELSYILNGEATYRETIALVDLEEIRIDEGGANTSISLVGHRTSTYTPKSIALQHIVYSAFHGGKYRYRCAALDLYLSPGDTAVADGNSFTVDEIQYIVSPDLQMMEVKEA